MKQLFLFVLLLCAFSCGQTQKKVENTASLSDLHKSFVEVILDSTSSWQMVNAIALPFVDSLCIAASDENSLEKRLFGQEWGYMTIGLITEKYSQLFRSGNEVSQNDYALILDRLSDAVSSWFYSDDDILPCIWRDHYYTCNQNADNPVDGYFHIMITLPTEEDPLPSLQIFYPEAAKGDPYLILSQFINPDGAEESPDNREVVQLKDWLPKDGIANGFPMYAEGDGEIVNKMLKNDVMYLMFTSEATADGTPGETEIARVNLHPMQRIWEKVINKKKNRYPNLPLCCF